MTTSQKELEEAFKTDLREFLAIFDFDSSAILVELDKSDRTDHLRATHIGITLRHQAVQYDSIKVEEAAALLDNTQALKDLIRDTLTYTTGLATYSKRLLELSRQPQPHIARS